MDRFTDSLIAAPTRAYEVRIDYLSAAERFATETLTLEVADGLDVHAIAQAHADASPYTNSRIPDLLIAIRIEPADSAGPEDPDPRPPTARGRPVCPRCGGDDILLDACARWDVERQCRDLAGTHDCQTCGDCGAEGDDLAQWLAAGPRSPADHFFWAVIDALQSANLARHPPFQRFCIARHGSMFVEEAAIAWKSRAGAP